MLKSKPTLPEALESRYGSAVPGSALQALQRDGFIAGTEPHKNSVYQKPMVEVSRHSNFSGSAYLNVLYVLKVQYVRIVVGKTKPIIKESNISINVILNMFIFCFAEISAEVSTLTNLCQPFLVQATVLAV